MSLVCTPKPFDNLKNVNILYASITYWTFLGLILTYKYMLLVEEFV